MPHALVVDDDTNALSGLAELVAHEGFTVATASTLQEARERMLERRPDVVLLDIQLPDGSGMDCFRMWNRVLQRRWSSLPVMQVLRARSKLCAWAPPII